VPSSVAHLPWNPSAMNSISTACQQNPSTLSANIVSCYQAGAFFGALLSYPTGHYLGRRMGLVISSAICLLGAGIMLGSNAHGLGYLYTGRVIAGLGIGSTSALIPIYMSELAPPAIRGRLVGIPDIGLQIGGLVGFWINVRSCH
jgi:MFS family permease